MGTVIKKSKKGIIYSYLGIGLGFFTSLIQPQIFTPFQIGIARILNTYSNLFRSFFGLGFEQTTLKFFPSFRNADRTHNGFLGIALIYFLTGCTLIAITFFGLKDYILERSDWQGFEGYYFLILPIAIAFLLYSFLDNYLISLKRPTSGLFYREVVQRALILVSMALFFISGKNFNVFIGCYAFALILPTAFLIYEAIRAKEIRITFDFTHLKRIKKEFFSVSVFGLMVGSTGHLLMEIDAVMISLVANLAQTGIYSVLTFYAVLVSIPSRSIKRVTISIITEAWNNNDLEMIRKVYRESSLNMLIIGLYLFMGLWCNRDLIFYILPGGYEPFSFVLLFLGLNNLIDMATGSNSEILAYSRYYKYSLYFIIVLLGSLVALNYVLIPIYGINGAAVATLAAQTLYNIIRSTFLYRKFGLYPFGRENFYVLLAGGTIMLPVEFIDLDNEILQFLLRSFVITTLFTAYLLIFKPSKLMDEQLWKLYDRALKILLKVYKRNR